jgi:PAS domain S-box-containing protein
MQTEVTRNMLLSYKSDSRFYPKATGDPGRDRNARTVQFSSLLLASTLSLIAASDLISHDLREMPFQIFAVVCLVAAMVINRAGKWEWAAGLAYAAVLLTAVLLVFEARDGFRSNAMLIFPGMLLLSVMLLNRLAYTITAGGVLLAVAALGIAERQGLTHAIRGVRSSTTYETIFFVDLFLLVIATIGSRLSRDVQSDVFDLRATINRLSEANLELRTTADAWRNSEQQLDRVYNTVADPIFHLAVEPGGRFRFVSVNASFFSVTGLSREMVVGRTVTEVIPEPSLTMVLSKYQQAIEKKATTTWEETSDYPRGRLTGIVSIVPAFDEEGACTHLIGSVHDVTDLRRAQAADFARQKLESLGTLAAGIAHDFNNLLGAVLVQAEMALMELGAGSNPEEELRTIRGVAVRGADVVRQLMTYAGKESPAFGPVDISQTIGEMNGLLNVSVPKHVLLELQLGKDLPFVRANPAQLQQVVMNLVTNASDAVGQRGGLIRVTTSCVDVHRDSWGVSQGLDEGDHVQLEVSDTGCGMPPETQARVFDPFFTTKSAGHGLGLSIIHGIVRGLNGAIQVMSDPGKGTTFKILLPAAEAMAGQIDAVPAKTTELAGQLPHATILVVEDEGPLRQATVKVLRRAGLDVLEAADGTTAIDVIRTNAGNFDLILLDMTIPGASSIEVMAEAARTCPNTGMILTSAYSQEMLADALSHPQVRCFLRKPFGLTDLERTVQKTLSDD